MLRRSLELVSPIPPMRTGTASYLNTLVSRIAPSARVQDDVVIVSDPAGMPNGSELPDNILGVPVVSYIDRPANPPVGVTRIVFLANNQYHVFAHEMLRRQLSRAEGRTIVVLHDPSMFMVHRHMVGGGVEGFGVEALIDSTKSQLGDAAERLVLRRLNEMLPDVFEHGVHCMGNSLRVSDEIWVHSLYAANRIVFENDIELARLPPIRVCAHPHPDSEREDAPKARAPRRLGEPFRIGVFGWVTPPKRVVSVLRGFAMALDRLSAEERPKLELFIVGRKPLDSAYDPAAEARNLELGDQVQFIDYPDASTFENLIQTCDLIFNLRYPSCGETSGTLASAEATSARYVVSRYQSFREAQGAWRFANVAQPYEVWDIAQAIADAFYEGAEVTGRLTIARPSIAPVEKLILCEIFNQRMG